MKIITICDKQYEIECNAFTYIQYRKVFDKGIFEDIQIIKDYLITQTITSMEIKEKNPKITEIEMSLKLNKIMEEKIDSFIEAITRIAYILIYTANADIADYETFLRGISKLNIDDDWIVEVTEFAVDCFC